ncbi:hypothetical protein Tco_0618015 [Tanacetum coccineum]
MVRRLLDGVGDDVFGGYDDGEVVVLVLVTVDNGSNDDNPQCWSTYCFNTRWKDGATDCKEEVEELESKRQVGGRTCDLGGRDLLPTIVAQVGDRVSNQGNIGNQNDNAADDNIPEDDRNVNIGTILYRVYGGDFDIWDDSRFIVMNNPSLKV